MRLGGIFSACLRRKKLRCVNPALRAGFTPLRFFLLSPPKPLRWASAGAQKKILKYTKYSCDFLP